MLTILDYGAGNLTSVLRALSGLGIPAQITADPGVINDADGIIFPGVGAAEQAMGRLKDSGLDKTLADAVAAGRPLLGICLGCQILLEHSDEEDTDTLGIIPGRTIRFPDGLMQEDGTRAPVPHMGWNTVEMKKENPLFNGIPADAQFYFVHSYYVQPDPSLVIGTTRYGMEFCSVYGRTGLWATQFHPEKSGRFGLKILSNFYDYCRENRHAV